MVGVYAYHCIKDSFFGVDFLGDCEFGSKETCSVVAAPEPCCIEYYFVVRNVCANVFWSYLHVFIENGS